MRINFLVILYVLVGFLVFSPDYVNFPPPTNSFELWIIVFLIFFRKKLTWKFNQQLLFLLLGFVALFVIGVNTVQAETYVEYYQMSRQWIMILLFSYISCKSFLMNPNILYWISIGTIIGGILMGLTGLEYLEENQTLYLCPTILAMPLSAALSFYKPLIYKVLTFLLLFLMAGLSQTRGIILYGILCYFITWFLYSAFIIKNILNKTSILLIIGFIAAIIVYYNVEDSVRQSSKYLHYRLYNKMENVGEISEDQSRLNQYYYVFNHYEENLLPHGFYLRRGINEWGRKTAIGVNDSGFLELVYTFGFILVTVLLFVFFKHYKRLFNKRKELDEINFALLVTSTFIPFSLFMGYAILKAPYSACFWGIYIGLLRTYNKPKSKNFFKKQNYNVRTI